MKSFEKTCIPVKHFSSNYISCQAVCNEIVFDLLPVKAFQKLEKIVIMHGKAEFYKIKGSICNISIEASNIWNVLQRLTVPSDQ